MFKKLTVFMTCVLMVFAGMPRLEAGGRLETIDITNAGPSPIPGHIAAKVIGIQWDRRSLPVQYSMNTTLNPIPNPLGGAVNLGEPRAGGHAGLLRPVERRANVVHRHANHPDDRQPRPEGLRFRQ